jgi:alkylation response protein AidB-like acyl-CoA dehydrogenase
MDLELSDSARAWRDRVRAFVDAELIPWEVHAESHGGALPPEIAARHLRLAVEMGLSRMDIPVAHGGLGLGLEEQCAVWEQLGRVTNALCWCFPEAQHWMVEAFTPAQFARWVAPLMRGETRECYAITEAESGSWETIDTVATRCEGGYRINGEKWFVTSANLADFFFLQARVGEDEYALFVVPLDAPGVSMIASPMFSHTFASHHPTYRFSEVFVPAENRLGAEGDGMSYTRSWFRHERLMIAARCCGAAARLIEEALAFATTRKVNDGMLSGQQVIRFMFADSVTELWAARLMLYEAAGAHARDDVGLSQLHSRCSMVKLYCSEMANRVADRAVQIFGGRGYMREYAAERFFRELRVDRIWEGTSEIQRLIIANSLEKRGLDGI